MVRMVRARRGPPHVTAHTVDAIGSTARGLQARRQVEAAQELVIELSSRYQPRTADGARDGDHGLYLASCHPYTPSATIVSAAPLLCATTMNFLVDG